MDEYPAGSLDHNIPFLLTLGTRTDTPYDAGLSPALKEQAVLIRSDLPALDSHQAHALLRYIQDRDASHWPCNARDAAARKYRFRVKTAERVRACPVLPAPSLLSFPLLSSLLPSSLLPSSLLFPLPPCTS